jgi:hypothetical protein
VILFYILLQQFEELLSWTTGELRMVHISIADFKRDVRAEVPLDQDFNEYPIGSVPPEGLRVVET